MALALAALVVGYWQYGWPGLVLALTVIVFWLLLQFSRAMRAMRLAGAAPVGRVASAVMLQSRLREGMRLLELIQITRSLVERYGGEIRAGNRPREEGSGAVISVLLLSDPEAHEQGAAQAATSPSQSPTGS